MNAISTECPSCDEGSVAVKVADDDVEWEECDMCGGSGQFEPACDIHDSTAAVAFVSDGAQAMPACVECLETIQKDEGSVIFVPTERWVSEILEVAR